MHKENLSAREALIRLKKGNQDYLEAAANPGDISKKIRRQTYENGQKPYGIIVTCSDSRVIPESIFMAGIGELFVIRVAGNVIGPYQLGSIEYAACHLGINLVLVLGHSRCGAVEAAMGSEPEGFVKFITDEIKKAVGEEKDDLRATCLNVENSVSVIQKNLNLPRSEGENEFVACGAVYHTDTGLVEFLD